MPIPVIKNFLSLINVTYCKIPQIFFLSISKSFGFLKKILLLVNEESNFLTKRQLIFVKVLMDRFVLFISFIFNPLPHQKPQEVFHLNYQFLH